MIEAKASYQQLEDELSKLRRELEILRKSDSSDNFDDLINKGKSRYSFLIENHQDISYTLTANGRLTYISPEWTNLLGHNASDVKGQTFEPFLHPDDIEKCTRFIQDILETGQRKTGLEYRVKHSNGSWYWHSSNINPVKDASGNIIGLNGTARDITDRKLIEEDLLNKTHELERYFTSALDLLCIADTEGHFIRLNQEWENTLGYKISDLENSVFFDFVHPDDLQKTLDAISTLDKNKEILNFVNRYRCKDGTYRYIEWRSHPQDGLIYASARDITKRVEAEEVVRISEARLKRAEIASKSGNWELHLDTKIMIGSEGAMKIYGVVENRFESSIIEEISLPEYRPLLDNALHNLISNNEPYNIQFKIKTKDTGEIKDIHSIAEYDKEKKILFGVIQDITERKKAEDALMHSNSFNALLIQTIPFGMNIVDEDGIILFQSEKMTTEFGKARVGEKCWDNMRDDRCQGTNCPLRSGIVIGKTDIHEAHGLSGGKSFQINYTGMMYNGKKAMLEIFQDITERSQHELEIAAFNEELTASTDALRESYLILEEAKERAEESDRLKTAFLANISHEIRTPMNGIIGFADLLKQPKLTGEEQQKYIGIIEKSGARLLNIINDLINISKIESGQMEVSYSKTNINEQLDFLFNFFQAEANQKGLHLSVKYPLLLSQAIIITDREKIYAILTNLIKNAIKFTKSGSIEFGYDLKGKNYEFFVKDTGIGIPVNMRKTVFDRFVQADSDLANGYEGAGLGLSISEAYVSMLGGKLWLESEEGTGTSFFFSIPNNNNSISFKNLPLTGSMNERNNNLMNRTILIAEDDAESLMYLTIILEGSGFKLLIAKTGQEAVDICRNKEEIHLVLMDIKMPVMDGHTAAKIIKEFRPELPIIAQTAYALDTEVEKYSKVFDDYLTKPVKAEQLKAKIALHIIRK